MNELRVQLKVCEGCGALWLRAEAFAGVYCRGCMSKLELLPVANLRKFRKRKRHPCTAGGVGGDEVGQ
jgi:hypothetical protein